MKHAYLLLLALTLSLLGSAQSDSNESEILPKYMTEEEKRQLQNGEFPPIVSRGIETPPPYDNLRNMAEWEEIQALTIAWTAFPSILKQIVAAAKEECEVIILSESTFNTIAYLNSDNAGGEGLDNLDNVTILDVDFDSIWMRDYAANPVYGNEVDDLIMVDWIYNRPNRPDDDASPEAIAEYLGLDLYCLTDSPTDLVNTGGNYMSDGFGNGFASKLILEENEPFNGYGVSAKSEEEIREMLAEWLGIDTYILMEELPFDLISHIDMSMKLIDEETIVVGDFGNDSDGPQIQANMEFILNNYTTKWGTPWKLVWLPMVPAAGGGFPDGDFAEPYYRTFTNSIFINKTLLVPTYREEYDTTALRIYREELPGYNVVGIDCDDQPDPIISAAGALHCITHSVGVEDPLLISHNPLEDTDNTVDDYLVDAYINHRSGISQGKMYWRLEGETDYTEVTMSNVSGNDWQASIPAHPAGTTIEYYVFGESQSGKTQNRPMPAPEGYWNFDVVGELVNIPNNEVAGFSEIYPNPASAITVIPVNFRNSTMADLTVYNAQGQKVLDVHSGVFPRGESKYFIDASKLSAGMYTVKLSHKRGTVSQGLVVR